MTTVAPSDSGSAVSRGPGRPRAEELDGQILAATLSLIDAEEDVTVARIVNRSGVSKAAIYRRWPSITKLIAVALDVGRTVPPELPVDGDLREAVLGALLGELDPQVISIPEARFRQRISLVMADRSLQKEYWSAHVVRRRAPMERAIQAGIDRGVLRSDLSAEAAFDAMAGVFYYQLIVRGDALTNPAAQARSRAALEMIWRGMLDEKHHGD